jgi:PAS domain S-box-containing protein
MQAPRQSRLRQLALLALLAGAYFVAARLSLLLAFPGSSASPVWPPSGIAFAALALLGRRAWPAIALGAFSANLVVFGANPAVDHLSGVLMSAGIAVGNTLEAVVGVWLMRRYGGADPRQLLQLQNVYRFAVIALVVSAMAAIIGSAALLAGSVIPSAAQWDVMSTWWIGDVAGILTVAPVLMAWFGKRKVVWTRSLALEAGGTLLVMLLLAAAIFGQRLAADGMLRMLAYLFIPAIGWAAYRHGLRGATLCCVIVAGAAVIGTTRGYGPFAAGTLNDALVSLETFIALCSLIGLVLCADMDERRRQGQGQGQGRQVFLHWATLFIGIGLTTFVWNLVATNTEREARERFDALVTSVEQRIHERMESHGQGMRSAQALFKASVSVEKEEWHDFVEALDVRRNFVGMRVIGFAQQVSAAERPAFEKAMRAVGAEDFSIHPAGERESYTPVTFVEPFAPRNRRQMGFDMSSEPVRNAAMQRARETGEPSLSGKLLMPQEPPAAPMAAVLMYAPVYRNGAHPGTPKERVQALRGYVFGVFRVTELIDNVVASAIGELGVEIFDGDVASEANRMYSNLKRNERDYPNPLTSRTLIQVQDHSWTMVASSHSAFEDGIDRQKAQIVLITGAVISLLFFGVVRALSARREYALVLANDMTAALAQSERKFESMVNSASEFSIIATDTHGMIEVFSVGAERMLGYKADEMVGRRTVAVIHLEQEVAARGAELKALTGMAVSGFDVFVEKARLGIAESREWTYVRKDGQHVPVNLVVSAIFGPDGEIVGFLGVANDITRQQQLQASLLLAKDQAEAASRAKSEFVANMSHEIRTPMNAVLGMSHLLAQTSLTDDQKRYLDMIRVSGQSLLSILNDILDFSKVESGHMELDSNPFQLGEMLDTLANIMTVNSAEKDLDLAIGVLSNVPHALVGDGMRLQQVLVNLVGNAIKFTEKGEVSLLVEALPSNAGAVELRFRVRDSGIGMNRAQRERLFSAFSQADASITRRFGGTGLGLAICRHLVALMNGTIEVHSAPGEGSEFCVTVPMLRGESSAPPVRRSLRLLVADDNATSRDYLCHTIVSWHCEADSAPDGQSAVDMVAAAQAGGRPYDALLTDWNMPGLDSIAIMEALQSRSPMARLPVVLMASAFGRGRLSELADTWQPDALLLKPVNGNALFTVLYDRLGLGHAGGKVTPSVAHAEQARQQIGGARLLLVEDNPLNQIVARTMLEGSGATVDVVDNGAKAVERLRTEPGRYGLVLMDVQMPVMDGFAATRAIRKELGLSLPIVAMSAGVMASERAQCVESGMNDFIAKPVELEEMLATIARHLQPAAPVAAASAPAVTGTAAVTAAQQAPPSAADGVFDVQQLLHFGNDDPNHLLALLGLIRDVCGAAQGRFDSALTAWRAGDAGEAKRTLHSLRGSIGTLGARRFAASTLALEKAVQHGEGDIDAMFDQAATELTATLAALNAWLASQQGSGVPALAPGESDGELARWQRQLAESNLAACDSYARVRPALAMRLDPARLAALDRAIEKLDFAGARQLL